MRTTLQTERGHQLNVLMFFFMLGTINPLHAQWVQTNGTYGADVHCFAVSDTNIFAGTHGRGVFISTNNGTSWTQVDSGLTDTYVNALAVSGTNILAGTGRGVWRRPLSEMITSVERFSTDLPTDFSLEQNYPNPFNPATNIMYTVPGREYVNLTVYNILGEKIATLVDEEKAPGKYTVTFDGSRLPSGVYFYRLHAGRFNETRQMVLVK
jgi:hypothetical protein